MNFAFQTRLFRLMPARLVDALQMYRTACSGIPSRAWTTYIPVRTLAAPSKHDEDSSFLPAALWYRRLMKLFGNSDYEQVVKLWSTCDEPARFTRGVYVPALFSLCKLDRLEPAIQLLNQARASGSANFRSYQAVLSLLVKHRKYAEAAELFREAVRIGRMTATSVYTRPIHMSYVAIEHVVRAQSSVDIRQLFTAVKELWYRAQDVGVPFDDKLVHAYLHLLSLGPDLQPLIEEFQKIRQQMPSLLSTRSYNQMIWAMAQHEQFGVALELFDEALKLGLKPDKFTYHVVLNACAKRGDVASIETLVNDMRVEHLEPDQVTYNIMMEGHGRAGLLDKCEAILQSMRSCPSLAPDRFTYFHLFDACARSKDVLRAERLWHEMIAVDKLERDADLYGNLLEVYMRAQKYSKAVDVFREMAAVPIPWRMKETTTFAKFFVAHANREVMSAAFVFLRTAVQPHQQPAVKMVSVYNRLLSPPQTKAFTELLHQLSLYLSRK